jgi:hypothetical protein
VVIVVTFALVPRQSARAFGIETGVIGLFIWVMQTVSLVRSPDSTANM